MTSHFLLLAGRRRLTTLLAAALLLGATTGTAGAQTKTVNLLENASFKKGEPVGWEQDEWMKGTSVFKWFPDRNSVGIRTEARANDARWIQQVRVEPGRDYVLSGWIKTQDVAPDAAGGCPTPEVSAGANLSVLENVNPSGSFNFSPPLLGNNDWTFRQVQFRSDLGGTVTIALRLGMYSCLTTGDALFRGVSLKAVP